jgi:hypothetical protein
MDLIRPRRRLVCEGREPRFAVTFLRSCPRGFSPNPTCGHGLVRKFKEHAAGFEPFELGTPTHLNLQIGHTYRLESVGILVTHSVYQALDDFRAAVL